MVNNTTRIQASKTGIGVWGEIWAGSHPSSGTNNYIGCNYLDTLGRGDYVVEFNRNKKLMISNDEIWTKRRYNDVISFTLGWWLKIAAHP